MSFFKSQPTPPPELLTPVALGSLGGVAALAAAGFIGASLLKPKTSTDFYTAAWLIFDGLIHTIFEGSFLWYSWGSRVASSTEPLAYLWKEYALADKRWALADPTVVSLELLTVFIGAPLCFYIARQIGRDDPARHFWLIVLSTGELYGGFMTFSPEWLTGSPSLDTSNWLYLWVYLALMNLLWVFLPLWLLVISYRAIADGLRSKVKTA